MKMDGTELAARFALPPNSRSYCGKPSFRKTFTSFLADKSPKNRLSLERELSKFAAHYAYLCLIAAASKHKPFDTEVAEALWVGNPLLKKVKKKGLARLIKKEFSGKGMLSVARAKKFAEGMPEGFVPHHSFHVLYLHTISGVIEPSVESADSCRVSWGKVTRTGSGFLEVATQKLVRKGGNLALVPCSMRWKASCAGIRLLEGVKAGDIVASHWGVAVMKLTPLQARRLAACTHQNIKTANANRTAK